MRLYFNHKIIDLLQKLLKFLSMPNMTQETTIYKKTEENSWHWPWPWCTWYSDKSRTLKEKFISCTTNRTILIIIRQHKMIIKYARLMSVRELSAKKFKFCIWNTIEKIIQKIDKATDRLLWCLCIWFSNSPGCKPLVILLT